MCFDLHQRPASGVLTKGCSDLVANLQITQKTSACNDSCKKDIMTYAVFHGASLDTVLANIHEQNFMFHEYFDTIDLHPWTQFLWIFISKILCFMKILTLNRFVTKVIINHISYRTFLFLQILLLTWALDPSHGTNHFIENFHCTNLTKF